MSYLFLETNRLIVRQWEPDDTTALWKIMSDSRMHCYTGDVPWTLLRTAEYIRFMANRNFRSLDLFHGACILKQGQTLIGLTGLNPYQLKRPEIEWQLGVSH